MNESSTTYILTTVEACKLIRKAKTGIRFCVHLRFDLPVDGDPGKVYRGAGSGFVDVSRKDATRIVKQMIAPSLEVSGARIKMTIRTTVNGVLGARTVYWIGG